MQKFKLHSVLIRLFIFLLFITISSAAYLLLPDKKQTEVADKISETSKINFDSATTTATTELRVYKNTAPEKTTTTPTTSQNYIQIIEYSEIAFLIVGDKVYDLNFNQGDNLYTAMKNLSKLSDFKFGGKVYAEMGFFIDEINGVKNDKDHFWVYYLNGKEAKLGISNYILKSNDQITWKYEKNKF